jgi:hypothetical protein
MTHLGSWGRPKPDAARRRRVDELELHLMRCRRRDESAWVLVARLSGSAPAADLLDRLRLTDTVRVETTLHGKELACILDAAGLDRQAVERRLRGGVHSGDVRFGWSRFPEDGAGLDVLLHLARARLPRPTGRAAARPAGALPVLEVDSE